MITIPPHSLGSGQSVAVHLLQLDPSPNTLKTLVQLHRTLKFPRGNCILVGSLGQPLESLARFALYVAGYSLQPLDTAKGTTAFSDGLRTLFRQAGLEGKPTAVIVNVRCVHARWS